MIFELVREVRKWGIEADQQAKIRTTDVLAQGIAWKVMKAIYAKQAIRQFVMLRDARRWLLEAHGIDASYTLGSGSGKKSRRSAQGTAPASLQ